MSVGMRGRVLPFAIILAAACLTATAAGSGAKPTIGRPVATPTKPRAGSRFKLLFHVAHATSAKFAVTLGGKVQRHTDSFRGGTAVTTLTVPARAGGKALVVTLTAREGTLTATKRVTYPVPSPPPPSLSIQDASVAEGNSGTTPLPFQVTLSHAATKVVTVAYAAADGTATAPGDYSPAEGTLTFAPGTTTKAIVVSVIGDKIVEPDENLAITLSDPVNATLATAGATGTITSDDIAAPVSPGNWQGDTQEANHVYFSVTSARTMTGFQTNSLTENCNGGSSYLQGSVNWGSQSFPIGDDGTFLAQYSWTGSQTINGIEYTAQTWKLTGTFATGTTISGTIAVTDELNYQGTHYSCAGSVTFTATFLG
jgi:hypothetical protein